MRPSLHAMHQYAVETIQFHPAATQELTEQSIDHEMRRAHPSGVWVKQKEHGRYIVRLVHAVPHRHKDQVEDALSNMPLRNDVVVVIDPEPLPDQ